MHPPLHPRRAQVATLPRGETIPSEGVGTVAQRFELLHHLSARGSLEKIEKSWLELRNMPVGVDNRVVETRANFGGLRGRVLHGSPSTSTRCWRTTAECILQQRANSLPGEGSGIVIGTFNREIGGALQMAFHHSNLAKAGGRTHGDGQVIESPRGILDAHCARDPRYRFGCGGPVVCDRIWQHDGMGFSMREIEGA